MLPLRRFPAQQRRPHPGIVLLLALWLVPDRGVAAPPQLQPLNGQSLQTGAATTLVLDGADLVPEPRLLLPFTVVSQSVKPGATANRIEVDVKLPPDVAPGIYFLRIANAKGISNAVAVSVDDLPTMPLPPQLPKLPVSVHGSVTGSDTAKTSFTGKKGERLVLDLECRRLGSQLDPVLELVSPQQKLLALGQGQTKLQGDVRIDVELPVDGNYSIQLRDALFQAAAPSYFRLKIGDLYYVDAVFPLGVQRGQPATVQLLGRLPGETRLSVHAKDPVTDLLVLSPRLPRLIGPLPRLHVGDIPQIVQTPPVAGKLQEVAVPAVLHGRLAVPGGEDRYRLLVKPGTFLRCDVLANRMGSPLDGVLTVQKEDGSQLAFSDDRPDTIDPGFEFPVPADVKSVVLVLRDLHGRGGADFLYRIAVAPTNLPDFSLALVDDRLHVPARGKALLRVRANRAGYDGPIQIRIPDLPDGASLKNDTIPAGASEALVSVVGPEQATAQRPQRVTSVVGTSADPAVKLTRIAMAPETAPARGQAWLRQEFGVAVTEASPLRIEWSGAAIRLPLGAGLPGTAKVTREASAKGAVRLALVTSQTVPKRPDGQEDMTRAIRLEGAPMIAVEQNEGPFKILVPPGMPQQAYDLALRAELIDPTGAVMATAVSDVRRLEPGPAFALELVGKPEIDVKAGATTKVTARIQRYGDFAKPVAFSLKLLEPADVLEVVMQPPAPATFDFAVTVRATAKPGTTAKLKLVGLTDAGTPTAMRSNEIDIALKVVP